MIHDINLVKKLNAPATIDRSATSKIFHAGAKLPAQRKKRTRALRHLHSENPKNDRGSNLKLNWYSIKIAIVALLAVICVWVIFNLSHSFYKEQRQSGLENARKLLANKKFLHCREIINRNLAKIPTDPNWSSLLKRLNRDEGIILLQRANLEYERNNLNIAMGFAQDAIRLLPDNDQASELMERIKTRSTNLEEAKELLAAEEFNQCRSIVQVVLTKFPHDDQWTTLQKQLNVAEGHHLLNTAIEGFYYRNPDENLEMLKKSIEYLPGNKQALKLFEKQRDRINALDKANELIEKNAFDECRLLASRHVKFSPNDQFWLKVIERLDLEDCQRLFQTATTHFAMARYKEARDFVKRALLLVPNFQPAIELETRLNTRDSIFERIQKHLRAGNYQAARNAIEIQREYIADETFVRRLENEINVREGNRLLTEAVGHFEQNNYGVAERKVNRVLQLLPENQSAAEMIKRIDMRNEKLELAKSMIEAGDFDACREFVRDQIAFHTGDTEWLYILGRLNEAEKTANISFDTK